MYDTYIKINKSKKIVSTLLGSLCVVVPAKLFALVPAKLLRVVPAKFYFHLADIRLCLVGRKLLSFAG